MATGGGFPRLKQSKSETKQRSSNWARSVGSDKDDALSLTSFPSDIRINNWDLSDLRPTASADSRRRKKSKGNPEREREQSLSMDSPPPHGEPKQRTPSSWSRTRNTPRSQRDALEKLKQKLTYDEEQYSTDGERNNERSVTRGRRRHANNREAEGAAGGGEGSGQRMRTNRNNNTEFRQPYQAVGRLVQIQDYIKQAKSMMETLQKSGDSGNAEDLAKIKRLISSLQEQEQGYLNLLPLLGNQAGAEAAVEGEGVEGAVKRDSDSEESVDLEVQSNMSETTLMDVQENSSSSSRPRIEDKLGLGSHDDRASEESKEEDTTLDNTLVAHGNASANDIVQSRALRSVRETLNSLTQMRDDPGEVGGEDDLTAQQRQQLMRVMMEKQEQLRQLQNRQDQLLNMKREAEMRLQEAQARDNQARAAMAVLEASELGVGDGDVMMGDGPPGQLKSNIVPYPESDDDEAANAREALDPLAELQQRLRLLNNEFSTQGERRLRNNTGGSSGGGSVSGAVVGGGGGGGGGASSSALLGQQQQLQDKVKELQEKKRSMDRMLAQLESLRSHRLQVLNNEASSGGRSQVSPQSFQQLPPPPPPPPTLSVTPQPLPEQLSSRAMDGEEARVSRADLSDMMNSILSEAGDQPFASMQEAREKLEKLQEVRERLNQLRSLVQYYQKVKGQAEGSQAEDAQSDSGELSLLPELHAIEETLRQGMPVSELTANSGLLTLASNPGLLALGSGQGVEGAFSQTQESVAMATGGSEEQSDEENASASEDWESGLGAWDRDPEVQEKVRKLMKAKDKLRDLQGLIAAIEAMPEGENIMDVSQNSNVRGGATQQQPIRVLDTAGQGEEGGAEGGTASVSEGEIPPTLPSAAQQGPRDDQPLLQQMEELSMLREERERLLALQQQLHTLQDRFVQAERDPATDARPESGPRKGEREQPPSTAVVTFASNDELYSKMRDQRIEREELRSKKKELEAIMKKDQNRRQYFRNQDNHSDTVSFTTGTDAFGANASADATMATWGGSTVDNLENITEDGDGQDRPGRQEDEEDGYPSDGIVQVEEEEEENDETDIGATYPVGARHRLPPPQVRSQGQGQGARPKTSRGRRGFPQPSKAPAGPKKSGKRPQSQPWGRVTRDERIQTRQSQLSSQGSEAGGAGEGSLMSQFRRQLEQMSSMCNNLMASPASSSPQSQTKAPSQVAPWQSAEPPALSLQQSPMEAQTQLMREMQQQQLMVSVSQCNQQLMLQQMDMAALHRQLTQLADQMTAMASSRPPLVGAPPHALPPNPPLSSQPYLSPLSSTLAAHVPNNVATSVNVQSSRQTTFTVNPNFTSNPYTSSGSGGGVSGGDSRERPQYRPVSQAVQTSSGEEPKEVWRSGRSEGGAGTSFPRPMRLWQTDEGSSSRQGQGQESVPKMNLHTFLKSRRKKGPRKQSADKSPPDQRDYGGRGGYRPGLSAGISGAGFDDVASVSSVASSQQDGAVGGQSSQTEPGELGELNLFEELRETIYTEVATLISQNESRPQFLLQLFTELQAVTSDLMRQRTLFALQEIAQTYPSVNKHPVPPQTWRPWKAEDNVTAELTPSESMLTSDDEEVKARVRQHATALERKKHKSSGGGWGGAGGGGGGHSVKNSRFDYEEMAATTSSLSTPTNDLAESPFSRDSLGDTVIHLDKALAKMRREMQQAEQERAERARSTVAVETRQDLGDQGSESSVSDVPYPRIDAQELDEQIKGVMGQVLPVIKDHTDDVFSPHLLSYVQRLVLSLVRQPGHTHQFARFFYGQLSSILHDSLSKFEGRRVREVGEDVLLDMSEVLFNELAFLRVMRDLDNPATLHKMRKQSWFSQPLGSQRTSAALVGEDEDAGGNESDNEASDDKDDDVTPQNVIINGRGEEEEEEDLGKDRDDELARRLVPQGGDEREEDAEDPQSTSAVHIQLAMSETKPFTRIGSDEDTEGSDESLSLEDPSDTAVSRTMMDTRPSDTPTDRPHPQGGGASAGSAPLLFSSVPTATGGGASQQQPQKEASSEREEEKEADTSEGVAGAEDRGAVDGSRDGDDSGMPAPLEVGSNGSAGDGQGEGVQVNGGVEVGDEIGLDDLPLVLNLADPEGVDQKRQEEDVATSGVQAILNSVDTGEELAGDGSALKEPEATGK